MAVETQQIFGTRTNDDPELAEAVRRLAAAYQPSASLFWARGPVVTPARTATTIWWR